MLFDLFFGLAATLFNNLLAVFPTWSLFGQLGLDVSGSGATIGRHMAIVDGIVPLGEPTRWAALAYTILLPLYALYKVASWVWRHIPNVLGFGPGAG